MALRDTIEMVFRLVAGCKGENDWQKSAGIYTAGTDDPLAFDRLTQVAGSPASYNTWVEFERLLQTMTHIAAVLASPNVPAPPIALGSKHGNCCGAAVDAVPEMAMGRMVIGHRKAIFGGHVMVNFRIGVPEAEMLLTYETGGKQRIIDSIFAPWISTEALKMLRWRKGDRCRIFVNRALEHLDWTSLDQAPRNRYIRGGQLIQPNYTNILDVGGDLVEGPEICDPDHVFNLALAWAIGSTSNSNTVTIVNNGMLIGNGVGQFSRVDAAELAIKYARDNGHVLEGAAGNSDSFFPFEDGPAVLADAGVKVILTTSGSIRDKKVRAFCAERGIALYMVPDAIGRGFYNH